MSRKLSANQKAFNKAVKFLLKQNKKSIDNNGKCLYRGPNNTRCGAGVLLPDRLYRKEMEGQVCWVSNTVGEAIKSCGYSTVFVRKIQVIHDDSPVHTWKEKFQELAEEEGLVWPVGV